MDYLTLYLLLKASTIYDLLTCKLPLFSLAAIIIYYVVWGVCMGSAHGYQAYSKRATAYEATIIRRAVKKATKKLAILFVVYIVFSIAIPTTPQLAAVYFGVQAKNSETMETLSKLPPKLAKFLEEKLDAYLEGGKKK